MGFTPYMSQFGGTQDPLVELVDMDGVEGFRLLQAHIESGRSENVRLAKENLGHQPRLQELRSAIRDLRGGAIEAAEGELAVLRVERQQRELRYNSATLRRTLREAVAETAQRCDELERVRWVDGWQNPEFVEQFLKEKTCQKRREKLLEKLQRATAAQ